MKKTSSLRNLASRYAAPTPGEILVIVLVMLGGCLLWRRCARAADPQVMCDETKQDALVRAIAREEIAAAEHPGAFDAGRLARLRAEFARPYRLLPAESP